MKQMSFYSNKKSSGKINVSLASSLTIAALVLQFFVPLGALAKYCYHNAWGEPSYGEWSECVPGEEFDTCEGGIGTRTRTVTETCTKVSGCGEDQCTIEKVYKDCPEGYYPWGESKCKKSSHPFNIINRDYDLVPETQVTTETEECVIPPDPEACPVDVCTNLEGVQTEIPEGYEMLEEGICTLIPPTDVCPNIEGVQESIPEGMIINDSGDCVFPPSQCVPGPIAILNGGFEEPVVQNEANWDIFTSGMGWLVQWVTSFAGAPDPANFEIQRGIYTPAEGSQYSEMDTDWDGPGGSLSGEEASVIIYQDVAVEPFATYQLSFKLSPRPGYDDSQNIVRVQFGDIDETISLDGSANSDTSWQEFSYPMTNDDSASQTLQFTDLGTPDSFGMLIDDVRVERTCPEEPTEGTLTVTKEFENVEEMQVVPEAFSFSVNGGAAQAFESDGSNDVSIPAGGYVVTEVDPGTDWTVSYEGCEGTMVAGGSATCIITNTYIPPTTDVELTKSVDPSSVESGQQATFTINVINHGPAEAENVVVTDALPAGLTYVSHSASVGDYSTSTNEWTIGNLAVEASASLTIVVTVEGEDGQEIVNEGSVAIDPNIDINAENNSDSASVLISETPPEEPPSEPTPPSSPPSGGGGGGNGPILQTDAYSEWLAQQPAPTEEVVEEVPEEAAPEGEVKGASIVLPATGFDWKELMALLALLFSLIGLMALVVKRSTRYNGIISR